MLGSARHEGQVDAPNEPGTVQLAVIGMTCSHCVASVSEELRRLEGVKDVQIELVAGGISKVTVLSDRALQSDEVAAALDEAGYELADLPR